MRERGKNRVGEGIKHREGVKQVRRGVKQGRRGKNRVGEGLKHREGGKTWVERGKQVRRGG